LNCDKVFCGKVKCVKFRDHHISACYLKKLYLEGEAKAAEDAATSKANAEVTRAALLRQQAEADALVAGGVVGGGGRQVATRGRGESAARGRGGSRAPSAARIQGGGRVGGGGRAGRL